MISRNSRAIDTSCAAQPVRLYRRWTLHFPPTISITRIDTGVSLELEFLGEIRINWSIANLMEKNNIPPGSNTVPRSDRWSNCSMTEGLQNKKSMIAPVSDRAGEVTEGLQKQ